MSLISKTSVFKLIRIAIFVVLLSAVNCQQYEGDSCRFTKTGKIGICARLTKCQKAKDDLRYRRIIPQVCGHTTSESIVCCSDTNLVARYSLPETTTFYERVTECNFPSHAVTVRRDQHNSKSWNKCIDLADSVFPCTSPGFNLGAPKIRLDTCQHTATELIIGGTAAKENEFPHTALLGFEDKLYQTILWNCGGTLISEQWVMTAAHCLYYRELKVDVSKVRLGGGNINLPADPKYLFSIIEIVKHPLYTTFQVYNDIALLKIDRPVKYSKEIRPACLHVGNSINDDKAIATGYGEQDNGTKSDKLLKVVLEKFSYQECSAKNPAAKRSPEGVKNETQICYGSHFKERDTCRGDSGGPLQIYNHGVHCTYIVFGVTSQGKTCADIGFPGLYTRVSAYIEWIESIVWPN